LKFYFLNEEQADEIQTAISNKTSYEKKAFDSIQKSGQS